MALTITTGIALADFGVPIIIGTLNLKTAISRTVTIFPSIAANPLNAFGSGTNGDGVPKNKVLLLQLIPFETYGTKRNDPVIRQQSRGFGIEYNHPLFARVDAWHIHMDETYLKNGLFAEARQEGRDQDPAFVVVWYSAVTA